MRGLGLLCIILLSALLPGNTQPVFAQQVQPGHYAPGWNGNLKAGIMVPDPGFYLQSTTMYFNARKFKDGSGNEVPTASETDYVLTALALVWRPDVQLLGADYQAVVTPAVGNLSGVPVLVDGQFEDPPLGLTDIFFTPLALGWHWSEFHLVGSIGAFAPTGKYSFGADDNTGLGFWTVMPFALGTYRMERGIFENWPLLATGGLFYEIHSNQQGRDFRPGDSFTFEWGLGLEVAERTNFGVVGFFYRQVTDAGGADAVPVDKYRSNGIGLTLSHGIGPVNFGLRFYQDYNVRNSPEGTLVYLEISGGWPREIEK